MLSKASIMALAIAVHLNYLIKSCPFMWNAKALELSICKKKSTMVLFRISTFLSVFHTVAITFRILNKLDTNNPTSISQFLLQSFFVVQGILLIVVQFNTHFRSSVACSLVSSTLEMDKRLSGKIHQYIR